MPNLGQMEIFDQWQRLVLAAHSLPSGPLNVDPELILVVDELLQELSAEALARRALMEM